VSFQLLFCRESDDPIVAGNLYHNGEFDVITIARSRLTKTYNIVKHTKTAVPFTQVYADWSLLI